MVAVIKRAYRKEIARIVCPNCHSLLEYRKDDIKTSSQYNREEYWIQCPVCKSCVDVDNKEFGWISPTDN